MAYKRKTKDIYEIHELVEGKYEYSCTEETWADAKKQAKCYRENGYDVKIVKKRERVGE